MSHLPAAFIGGNNLYAAEACCIHCLPEPHNPVVRSIVLVPDAHVIHVQAVHRLGALKPPAMHCLQCNAQGRTSLPECRNVSEHVLGGVTPPRADGEGRFLGSLKCTCVNLVTRTINYIYMESKKKIRKYIDSKKKTEESKSEKATHLMW